MRCTLGRQPSVLVVEDDADIRELLTHLLESEGYHAVPVADGATAVDTARVVHPDLITLDLSLPGLDGVAVLTQVKADPALRDIPVLVVSAHSESLAGPSRRMAFGVLGKPFDVSHFLERVSCAIRGRAAR